MKLRYPSIISEENPILVNLSPYVLEGTRTIQLKYSCGGVYPEVNLQNVRLGRGESLFVEISRWICKKFTIYDNIYFPDVIASIGDEGGNYTEIIPIRFITVTSVDGLYMSHFLSEIPPEFAFLYYIVVASLSLGSEDCLELIYPEKLFHPTIRQILLELFENSNGTVVLL